MLNIREIANAEYYGDEHFKNWNWAAKLFVIIAFLLVIISIAIPKMCSGFGYPEE